MNELVTLPLPSLMIYVLGVLYIYQYDAVVFICAIALVCRG